MGLMLFLEVISESSLLCKVGVRKYFIKSESALNLLVWSESFQIHLFNLFSFQHLQMF